MNRREPPFLDALNVAQEFGKAEGLGHEGIGTQHQGMLEIACFRLGREDHNRNFCQPLITAQDTEHFEAGHVREIHIEHY